jgi:hypothetical protein
MFDISADGMIPTRIAGALAVLMLAVIALSANAQPQSIPEKPASITTTHRAIPDDNLAYPVLITITGTNFTGSGFYLVTAKHVLFDPTNGKLRSTVIEVRSYSKDPSDLSPNIFELNLSTLEVKGHPIRDVAVVKIAAIAEKATAGTPGRATPLPGVLTKAVSANGILGVNPDLVKLFDQILVGNEVIVFGYPTSLARASDRATENTRKLCYIRLNSLLPRSGANDPRERSADAPFGSGALRPGARLSGRYRG